LMLTLLIQRINVSNRIVFALTYLLSRLDRDVLLLPNFQRSLALLASHFLGVQMYEPYYSQPKLFSKIFADFQFLHEN